MADIAITMCVEFDSIKFHNERPVVLELLVLGPLRSQGEVVLLVFAGVVLVAPIEKHWGYGLAPW